MTFDVSLRPIQFNAANGDRFELLPTVTNPTNSKATDTITLSVDGDEKYSTDVEIAAGNSERVKLAWTVNVEDNKTLPVTVSSSSDTDTGGATFRLYNDVIRVQFDQETRTLGISGDEKYVEDTDKVGPDEQ